MTPRFVKMIYIHLLNYRFDKITLFSQTSPFFELDSKRHTFYCRNNKGRFIRYDYNILKNQKNLIFRNIIVIL